MSWNVNSLAKENFQRVRFIEAHNSILNYDLISICETSLNDTVDLSETLLCLRIIRRTLGMRGLDSSIRIHIQSLSAMVCPLSIDCS